MGLCGVGEDTILPTTVAKSEDRIYLIEPFVDLVYKYLVRQCVSSTCALAPGPVSVGAAQVQAVMAKAKGATGALSGVGKLSTCVQSAASPSRQFPRLPQAVGLRHLPHLTSDSNSDSQHLALLTIAFLSKKVNFQFFLLFTFT